MDKNKNGFSTSGTDPPGHIGRKKQIYQNPKNERGNKK